MKGLIIHYIIGICALLVLLATAYYITENPKNLISGSIMLFAMFFVAFGQYAIIKRKRK